LYYEIIILFKLKDKYMILDKEEGKSRLRKFREEHWKRDIFPKQTKQKSKKIKKKENNSFNFSQSNPTAGKTN